MRATIGQLLVNEALPEDLRDYSRPLDKNGTKALMREVADKYPEQYKKIVQKLSDIGKDVAYAEGSSISLNDLSTAKAKRMVIPALRARIKRIAEDDTLTQDQKDEAIVKSTSKLLGKLDEAIMLEGINEGNKLATYAVSGARGNKSQFNQMRGSPLLVQDHRDKPIPVPILSSFSEGLDPVEMWASSYGVRTGYNKIKQATPKAGFFGKQLASAAHKLIVKKDRPLPGTGLPVDADDPDNEGSVLARDYDGLKTGTILTPSMLKRLRRKYKRLLVHSPISAPIAGGGVAQWAAGARERAALPLPGENIGIAAAQALSAPLAQSAISSKHRAGVAGASGGGSSAESQQGFEVINRLANIPKTLEGRAPVAELDGRITRIEKAPQGGKMVYMGAEAHYVSPDQQVSVKPGQVVEAGDVLSSGLPNPADIVRHKGIGEGRRYLMGVLRDVLQNSGVRVHRRNIELVSRALINHIRLTGDTGPSGTLPDDIIEYDDYAARYTPRRGSVAMKTKLAKNKYLEQPVLHYSIGTRITPRVMKELQDYDVKDVMAHKDKPEFEPEMQRAMDTMSRDPDWMTRMGGFNLQKNLLDAVQRGATSQLSGSASYYPSLARGIEFGRSKEGPY